MARAGAEKIGVGRATWSIVTIGGVAGVNRCSGRADAEVIRFQAPTGAARMHEDAVRAPPYPKPGDPKHNTGFNCLNMHEVMLARRMPAVRMKLQMGGMPQARWHVTFEPSPQTTSSADSTSPVVGGDCLRFSVGCRSG